jgi:hypothetical protein
MAERVFSEIFAAAPPDGLGARLAELLKPGDPTDVGDDVEELEEITVERWRGHRAG